MSKKSVKKKLKANKKKLEKLVKNQFKGRSPHKPQKQFKDKTKYTRTSKKIEYNYE